MAINFPKKYLYIIGAMLIVIILIVVIILRSGKKTSETGTSTTGVSTQSQTDAPTTPEQEIIAPKESLDSDSIVGNAVPLDWVDEQVADIPEIEQEGESTNPERSIQINLPIMTSAFYAEYNSDARSYDVTIFFDSRFTDTLGSIETQIANNTTAFQTWVANLGIDISTLQVNYYSLGQ